MGAGSLVGRHQELVLVRSLLAADRRRAVVLGGEAGVGKTRLAQAVADDWAAEGGSVEWVNGTAGGTGIPFGATLRLLPELSGSAPGAAPGADAALIQAAVAAARAQPGRLLVVDDAHSLDDSSALLVHHLVLDGATPLVITVRSGEPVLPALASLWKDHHAERVDVQPLGEPEASSLATDLLGDELDERTAVSLFSASEGNPLLLRELVRDAVDSGSLRRAEGRWRWDGDVGRGRRLREVVRDRLARLGEPGRRLVSLLALAEPLRTTTIRRLDPDVDLDAAEEGGLVSRHPAEGGIEVRLGHPLLGEVLIAGDDAAELTALRLSLADAIASDGAGDALVEARLRLDAGDVSQPDLFVRGAQAAWLRGAPTLARRLAEAAADAGGPPLARRLVGEALLAEHRLDEAIQVLEGVLPELDDDADLVQATLSLQVAYDLAGQPEAVGPAIRRARSYARDPVWRAVLEGHEVQHLMNRGRTGEALRRAEALLEHEDDPRVLLRLVSPVGIGRSLAGRTVEGLAFVAEMFPLALRHQAELPLSLAWVVNAQAVGLLTAGRLHDAEGLLDLVSQQAPPGGTGLQGLHGMLLAFAGKVALVRGSVTSAADVLARASEDLGDDDLAGVGRWSRSLQAEALALRGELTQARIVAEGAARARSRMLTYEGDVVRAHCWVTALGGEVSRATDGLLASAEQQRGEGQFGLEVATLHDAVRLGALAEAGDLLETALGKADSFWADAFRTHLGGLRSGRGGELEDAGERFARMGAELHAAEAMAAASRAYELEALRTRAASAARRRDELLASCGPVRTPALQDIPARVQLTRRERDVVELAARGLSNRQIAERLFVSIRTTEGHLYRAFAKLGVTNREELTEIFAPPAPTSGVNE